MSTKSRRPPPNAAPKARIPRKRAKAPNSRASVAMRRKIFVAEYLLDHDGPRAAIAAGFSPKSAYAASSRLLNDASVLAAIAAQERKVIAPLLDRYKVTAERVVGELARIGFSNIFDYGYVDGEGQFNINFAETTRDQAAAIASVKAKRTVRTIGDVDIEETTTELRLAPKREALVDLGKHLGIFRDDGAITVPVQFIVNFGDRPPPEYIRARLAEEEVDAEG